MNHPVGSIIASHVEEPTVETGFEDGWSWRDRKGRVGPVLCETRERAISTASHGTNEPYEVFFVSSKQCLPSCQNSQLERKIDDLHDAVRDAVCLLNRPDLQVAYGFDRVTGVVEKLNKTILAVQQAVAPVTLKSEISGQ